MSIMSRLVKSLSENGVGGTCRKAARHMAVLADRRVLRRFRLAADQSFDRTHGVDTSGITETYDFDANLSAAQKDAAEHYEPTPAPAIRALLRTVNIDHSKFTFVDFGSGKGRVLLLASEYPYKSIVGVEFNPTLHEVAVKNFTTWQSPKQKSKNLISLCEDATKYIFPEDPLVLFFFTPFKSFVFDPLLANLQKSLQANPRPIRILYYGTNQEFMDALERLKLPHRLVYDKRPFTAIKRYKGWLYYGD